MEWYRWVVLMSSDALRGKFIALEGGEGTGKSTQGRMLAESLRDRFGLSVITTREPGGTPGAEAIRQLLLDPPGNGWNAQSEALLFAAARADHVAHLILPNIEKGSWVISDRFIDSSRAYQGGASGLGDEAITALHAFGSDGLRPDCTILLEVNEKTRNRALWAVGILWGWAIVTVVVFMVRSMTSVPEDRPDVTLFTTTFGPLIVIATIVLPTFVAAWVVKQKRDGTNVITTEPQLGAQASLKFTDQLYRALVLPLVVREDAIGRALNLEHKKLGVVKLKLLGLMLPAATSLRELR